MRYKTLLLLACSIALASPAAFAGPASVHLKWGSFLNSQTGQTSCPSGTQIINVVEKVANDYDSGYAGNAWALDNYVRQIKVLDTGGGTYCATVSYEGNFSTLSGTSPDKTGLVGDGVLGTYEGGYTLTFDGTLLPSATKKANGSVGRYDYACDPNYKNTYDESNCAGYVDWTTWYFSSVSHPGYLWWGWTYHAGSNGSWIDAANVPTSQAGDITGN